MTRLRASAAVERLSDERSHAVAQARQAEIERRLLSRLVEARITRIGDVHYGVSESVYRNAFREAGLDPEGHPDEAARRSALARQRWPKPRPRPSTTGHYPFACFNPTPRAPPGSLRRHESRTPIPGAASSGG